MRTIGVSDSCGEARSHMVACLTIEYAQSLWLLRVEQVHDGLALRRRWAWENDRVASCGIDAAHQTNLLVAIFGIILVDANTICPCTEYPVTISNMTKSIVQGSIDGEPFPVN